ncbi:fimbrial protein [Escherichia coli]
MGLQKIFIGYGLVIMWRNSIRCLLPFLALAYFSGAEAKISLGEAGKLTFSVVAKGCEFEAADLEVVMGKMMLMKPVTVGRVINKKIS